MYENKKIDASAEPKSSEELLKQINDVLHRLGDTGRYKRLPEILKETREVLADKKILLIDDSAEVLATILPTLIVATGGKIFFHRFDAEDDQPASELRRIVDIAQNFSPDIVLCDFNLGAKATAAGIDGAKIVGLLIQELPLSLFVGISAEASGNEQIQKAGASVGIEKRQLFDSEGCDQLAMLAKNHQPFIERTAPQLVEKLVIAHGLVLQPDGYGGYHYQHDEIFDFMFKRNVGAYRLDQAIDAMSAHVRWDENLLAAQGLNPTELGMAAQNYSEYLRSQVVSYTSDFHKFAAVIGDLTYINHQHRIPMPFQTALSFHFT
jgi:CheY-like chemotaxis protein